MEKINGVPVTQDELEAWAAEAEQGYDVEKLRKRGRKPLGNGPSHVVPVRVDDSLLAALDKRAASESLNRSEAIRAALRSYVA